MAGTIIISNITTDSDNTFVVRSNTGATLLTVNSTGIDVANNIPAGSITSAMIANGTVIAADVAANTLTTDKFANTGDTRFVVSAANTLQDRKSTRLNSSHT